MYSHHLLAAKRMLANAHSHAQSSYKTTIYWTPAGQKKYKYIYLNFLTVWNDYLRDSTLFSKCLLWWPPVHINCSVGTSWDKLGQACSPRMETNLLKMRHWCPAQCLSSSRYSGSLPDAFNNELKFFVVALQQQWCRNWTANWHLVFPTFTFPYPIYLQIICWHQRQHACQY